MPQDKADIRRAMRHHRQALSDPQRDDFAIALQKQLSGCFALKRLSHLGFYLANDGELDPIYCVARAWEQKKKTYLPVIDVLLGKRMLFAPYHSTSVFVANRYGIPEPQIKHRELRSAKRLDAVFMPLVAFDKKGNRLGMGGGFYDRTLSFLQGNGHWKKPILIGIAFDFQEVDTLPAESWDIPLQYIITPTRVLRF